MVMVIVVVGVRRRRRSDENSSGGNDSCGAGSDSRSGCGVLSGLLSRVTGELFGSRRSSGLRDAIGAVPFLEN
jgi:hypothetical protein